MAILAFCSLVTFYFIIFWFVTSFDSVVSKSTAQNDNERYIIQSKIDDVGYTRKVVSSVSKSKQVLDAIILKLFEIETKGVVRRKTYVSMKKKVYFQLKSSLHYITISSTQQ